MPVATEHILTIVLVIATGWVSMRAGLLTLEGRTGIEKLTYYILFPTLIFFSLAKTDFQQFFAWTFGFVLILTVAVIALLTVLLKPPMEKWLGVDGPSFTSVFQGVTRWNTFIGLAVAGSMYGVEGLAMMAIAMVIIVPVVNVFCVLVLAHWAGTHRPSVGLVLWALLRNPFIWSCLLGMAVNFAGLVPGGSMAGALDLIGKAAMGTGLIVIGASLNLRAVSVPKPVLLLTTATKLLLMPVLGVILARLFGLNAMAIGITVISLAVPTSTSSYVLAKEMNGNAPLMAEIITFQTVVAMITMPLLIAAFCR